MKIIEASTPEQERKIAGLVTYFYQSIFPSYFSDGEITDLIQMNVLNVRFHHQLDGTLREAFQIIASMDIIIHLIETKELGRRKYQQLFNKNAHILTRLGMEFPFTYEHFLKRPGFLFLEGSKFKKAANEWLV